MFGQLVAEFHEPDSLHSCVNARNGGAGLSTEQLQRSCKGVLGQVAARLCGAEERKSFGPRAQRAS
jgi:hypothetical protein